jgi:ribosomal protein S1
MIDYLSLDLDMSNQDFTELVSGYGDTTHSYDTILNKSYPIESIEIVDKNIFCVIEGGVLVKLETSKELPWFYGVLLHDYVFNNRRSLSDFIEENPNIIKSKLQASDVKVTITSVNEVVVGSIMDYHIDNLQKQFFEQLRIIGNYLSETTQEGKEKFLEDVIVYSASVKSKNAGGYILNIMGVDVFIPNSMLYRKSDGNDYKPNDIIKVVIENYIKDKGTFVVSNLKLIQMLIPTTINSIDRDELLDGNVVGISNFGLFVSFRSNLYGLLHISEMKEETLDRYKNKEILVGDKITFYIKEYKDNKIDLTETSPSEVEKMWEDKVAKYKGGVFHFKVVKEIKSGYLFEFDDNRIRGFLYEVEARKYPMNILVGETYPVYVHDMDRESGKVFLKCPNHI